MAEDRSDLLLVVGLLGLAYLYSSRRLPTPPSSVPTPSPAPISVTPLPPPPPPEPERPTAPSRIVLVAYPDGLVEDVYRCMWAFNGVLGTEIKSYPPTSEGLEMCERDRLSIIENVKKAIQSIPAPAPSPAPTPPPPVPCLLYTSPSPRDGLLSRMPSSA